MAKELLLYSGIYNFTAEAFISKLDMYAEDDVTVRVNSPGGSVFAGWGMIAKMKEHKGAINIKVDGLAASMAFNMALFATNVEALDVSRFMFHRADMDAETDDEKKLIAEINKDLRKAVESKVDADNWEKVTGTTIKDLFESEDRKDVWLNAKEAKKLGIVSKIKKVSEASSEDSMFYKLAAMADFSETKQQQEKKEDNNITVMTEDKLKAEHPELYKSIFAMGAENEKDRVQSWLTFQDIDPKAVEEGIKNGKDLARADYAEFTKKAMAKNALGKIEDDNPNDVVTPNAEQKEENTEVESFLKEATAEAIKHIN